VHIWKPNQRKNGKSNLTVDKSGRIIGKPKGRTGLPVLRPTNHHQWSRPRAPVPGGKPESGNGKPPLPVGKSLIRMDYHLLAMIFGRI
jgi:hypothetical protein